MDGICFHFVVFTNNVKLFNACIHTIDAFYNNWIFQIIDDRVLEFEMDNLKYFLQFYGS